VGSTEAMIASHNPQQPSHQHDTQFFQLVATSYRAIMTTSTCQLYSSCFTNSAMAAGSGVALKQPTSERNTTQELHCYGPHN
jgi:hypothetical protein